MSATRVSSTSSSSSSATATTSRTRGRHSRARSASGSSHSSSGNSSSSTSSSGSSSPSKPAPSLPPFPILTPTSESVLEQNLTDVLWKTFVAFEQDCRDAVNLLPLLAGIESTVAAAIDPIQLAGNCLEECAIHIEYDIREIIEIALSSGKATGFSISASLDPNRSPPTSVASHSKQFTLSSTRLSTVSSTFRATQASLRYYGGAKKTSYQLDLFIHRCALPTSTALHKKGQEYSAASKWLKKALSPGSGNATERLLEPNELAVLRKAINSLLKWASGLREHADQLKGAASTMRTLLQERASLSVYSFPPKMSPEPSALSFETSSSPLSSSPPALVQDFGPASYSSSSASSFLSSSPQAASFDRQSDANYAYVNIAPYDEVSLQSVITQACSFTVNNYIYSDQVTGTTYQTVVDSSSCDTIAPQAQQETYYTFDGLLGGYTQQPQQQQQPSLPLVIDVSAIQEPAPEIASGYSGDTLLAPSPFDPTFASSSQSHLAGMDGSHLMADLPAMPIIYDFDPSQLNFDLGIPNDMFFDNLCT